MKQEVFYARIFTAISAALVIAALFWLIDALRPILLPFIIGMLIAYLFDPLADRLERAGASRSMASAGITIGMFAVFVAVIWGLGPLLIEQAAELVRQIPGLIQRAQQWMHAHGDEFLGSLRSKSPVPLPTDVGAIVGGVSTRGLQTTVNVLQNVIASGAAVLSLFSLTLITPIVTFYLLRDWDHMVARMNTLLPVNYADTIRAQLAAIDKTLAAYLRGQLHVMLVLAAYYGIALSLLSIPYALIIALITALLLIIPYVGTLVSVALAASITYLHFPEPTQLWWVLGVYAFGQTIEGQFLTPKLIGDQVGLHPLWVLFGLLAGGALFGFVGVLIAVPVTAVLGVLVRFAVAHYQQQNNAA